MHKSIETPQIMQISALFFLQKEVISLLQYCGSVLAYSTTANRFQFTQVTRLPLMDSHFQNHP